jgi:hypothetical protein
VTAVGLNGFAGTVSLACTGSSANTTCAMSPQSLTLPPRRHRRRRSRCRLAPDTARRSLRSAAASGV